MKIYLLMLALLLFSCSNTEIKIPKNILSEKVFENVLKEVHLAEAAFELKKNKDMEIAKNELSNTYFYIYKKHQISEDEFKETLNYYSGNPEKLEPIYTNILKQLNAEKFKIDQQETN
jgi:hypothetical protein